ncbi:EamA family transporter [uncultured Lacinutrix sp.]|uniref:EamA family transporter n=1 Tax=uncultured Lacinutrix sp. TaxID=574032 RepID=UPI0026337A4B|nr:EamA family transporter [uncultured Lacinutrix sp.]
MINLVLSILFSSSLYVFFKYFEKYDINTLHAIIVNYIVAGTCGFLLYNGQVNLSLIPSKQWFVGAIILGFLFIFIFNLMALTSQKNGLSVASVAGKMSVVVPIIFAVCVYKEQLSLFKILGIIIALLAVYFTSVKEKSKTALNKKALIYPLLLFIGSGIIDTFIKYMETNYVSTQEIPYFSAVVFSCAGLIGFVTLIIKKDFSFKWKNVLGGILLGVPNYFSIVYLLKALQNEDLNSSTVFTINNVAIVMISTVLGIIIFNERLIRKNWLGIGLAILSIILVAST